MIGELNVYKQVYQLQIELDNLEQEAIEMANVAINLEQYLKPIIGQFQGLIDRVVTIDGELSRSVTEVESLVQSILGSESGGSFRKNEHLSASLLNFLVTSEEKRGRLAIALERAEREGWQWTEVDIPDEEIGLETAIQRINTHVIERVGDFSTSVVGTSPIPQPTTPPRNPTPAPSTLQTFSFETVTLDNSGKIVHREKKQASYLRENLGKIPLEMVYIPGGTFLMGSPDGEGDNDERPQHRVTVPPFYLGKYPITQAQWRIIASQPRIDLDLSPDPSYFKGDNRPVECVNWYQAVEFCKRLSKFTGKEYHLPSEAQWEYACRGGTTTPFAFGATLSTEIANYGQNHKQTTPVGQFPPNAFGRYDMHGQVWEWCEDDWHDNYNGAPEDGAAWIIDNDNRSQRRKCLRGGSWYSSPNICRSALRSGDYPDVVNHYDGFRVACVSPGL
jgi:formylglycine-generating enzyme required for sulfatase activity